MALKWNDKAFSCVKTKANSHFAVKLSREAATHFLLIFWWNVSKDV